VATWIIFLGYQANKMERKNYELEQERRSLKELEQLKNNFVSLISHDLKTPIAKIQSVTDRLQRNSQAMDQFGLEIKSLANSSQELNKYIQSILRVLRVESSEFQLSKEVHDLNLAIEEAVSIVRPLAEEKNIKIQTELEPLYTMEMDYVLIKEVMVNLIENAVKYSPESSSPIVVKSYEDGDFVHVEVLDHGTGISVEDQNTIFGKFVRGKDQNLKTKGSGLGLYLVKYFIELHGGTIHLESQLGAGTKVHFKLPLTTEETAKPQDQTMNENQNEVIA
jgi:signal transduction histidine kinase